MSTPVAFESWSGKLTPIRRAAQRQAFWATALQVLPPSVGASMLASLSGGTMLVVLMLLASIAAFIVIGLQRARQYDQAWLLRKLDTHYPALEDSSAMVLETHTTGGLQALQRARIAARLEALLHQTPSPDFRPAVPRRMIVVCAGIGLALVALSFAMPALVPWLKTQSASPGSPAADGTAKIMVIDPQLRYEPPAYTGLSASTVTDLDAKLPQDSGLTWSLRFTRNPEAAALVFHDGSRRALSRNGERWTAQYALAASTLYRVEIDSLPAEANEHLYRLDAIPDEPPEITVRQPQQTLTVVDRTAARWELSFEARDDYGLGPAELTVSLAEGEGEQIKVSTQRFVLDGGSDRHERSYRKSLDLAALGYRRGDDLIVRLNVQDNHAPAPNTGSTASYILRWPPERGSEGSGLEGLVQKTLPAYFRSERQIIIDTEALVAQRGRLAAAALSARADELGVDQKVLRLRYGQFLGEGFESREEQVPEAALAARKAAAKKDEASPAESLKDVPDDHAPEVDTPARKGLGQQEDVLHEFGHAHDNAEAATLLDPETRRILKAALDEMWQAELKLRLAEPEAALPYEYKALDYIKQVQQAERIYLQRAGLELPQVDPGRRLSGERAGLSDQQRAVPVSDGEASPALEVWKALEQGRRPDSAALIAWLREHPDAAGADALGLVAAADRLQRDPDCAACRSELKAKLWPLLPVGATGVTARRALDAAGAAWLDALKAGSP